MGRVASWWRNLSTFNKVRAAILFSLFGLTILILSAMALYNHFSHVATGEPCTLNTDCRSRECLSVSDYQPASIWSQIDIVPSDKAAEMDRSWNDTFDPLSPSNDSLRPVGVARKYCTEPCQKNSDCPDSMICGQTQGFESSLFGFGKDDEMWVSGKGSTAMYCVHR